MFDSNAYQEVSMRQFNAMPRPGTFLLNGNAVETIRMQVIENQERDGDGLPVYLT